MRQQVSILDPMQTFFYFSSAEKYPYIYLSSVYICRFYHIQFYINTSLTLCEPHTAVFIVLSYILSFNFYTLSIGQIRSFLIYFGIIKQAP